MIVGRETERARLRTLLDEARRGRTGVLVAVGDPGIGKTALLDDLCAEASFTRVLRATGVESESTVPFAGLDAVLRPLVDLLPRLVPPQRAALETALALSAGAEAEPLAIGAGTLSLLAEAASEQPLLVCLDDAHWLDPPSAVALAFAARRLVAEEIAFVIATRPGEPSALVCGFPELELAPLARDDARRLVEGRPDVPTRLVERVLDLAAGNPLALLELPPSAGEPVPMLEPLPSGRVRQAFAARLDALPDEARLVLALAAVELDPDAVRRAAALLGLDEESVAAAEASGLARLEAGGVHFRHPLVRMLAYASLEPEQRRKAHDALARVLTADVDRDRRAWHLGSARTSPSPDVAALLEETAERARARGGNRAAADALERAARLSPRIEDRARRLTAAARSAFWSGDSKRGRELAEEALSLAPDSGARADALLEIAGIRGAQGDTYDEDRFTASVAGLHDLDPDRLTRLLLFTVSWRAQALDATGAVERATELERVAREAGAWWRPRGLAAAAAAHLCRGDSDRFWTLFQEVIDDDAVTANMALDLVWTERFAEARHALEATLLEGRSSGNTIRIIWNQACLAHLETRLGRLDAAQLAASEAITLGEAHGTAFWVAIARAALAVVEAWQGADECLRTAADAIAAARNAGSLVDELSARGASSLCRAASGEWEALAEELGPAERSWYESSFMEPSAVTFVPDLVEAYVRLDETGAAERLLGRFREAAERSQRRWALAAVARCEGLLAPSESFDEFFRSALSLLDGAPTVLERARAELSYGERLRRAGRRREARIQLRAAHETFAVVGAVPWTNRAVAELAATGETLGTRTVERRSQLTSQELQIAHLVAEGRTNREIAVRLYLSPKTIEYHLANAYRKLDVHSRAELTRLVS